MGLKTHPAFSCHSQKPKPYPQITQIFADYFFRLKAYPQITQISADFFFRLKAYPQITQISFLG
jgi:hypothetical protein